jgi:hypothetical protein
VNNLDTTSGWTEVQAYSTTTTWTMTNATAGRYLVEVWALGAGTSRAYEAYRDADVVTVASEPITLTAVTPSVTTTIAGTAQCQLGNGAAAVPVLPPALERRVDDGAGLQHRDHLYLEPADGGDLHGRSLGAECGLEQPVRGVQ